VAVAFANVLFSGKALAITDNANPLDFRYTEQNYGPGFVPAEEWTRRDLITSPNYRDPAAQALQAEPAAELLRRSLARGQFPFWDPYTGGGTPVFASLVPAYLFPPALLVVLLGNGSGVRNAYLLVLISKDGNHRSLPPGRYACELIKDDSGQWRFSRRTVFHDHDYTLDGIGL